MRGGHGCNGLARGLRSDTWAEVRNSASPEDPSKAVGFEEAQSPVENRFVITMPAIRCVVLAHRAGARRWQYDALSGERFGPRLRAYRGAMDAKTTDALTFDDVPFRGIVEQSLAGVYVVLDERFIYANDTFVA